MSRLRLGTQRRMLAMCVGCLLAMTSLAPAIAAACEGGEEGAKEHFSLSAAATKLKKGVSTKVTITNISGEKIEPTEGKWTTTGTFSSNFTSCLGITYEPIPAKSAECKFTTTYEGTGTNTEEFTVMRAGKKDSNTLKITGEP